jgi:hypothetical protein
MQAERQAKLAKDHIIKNFKKPLFWPQRESNQAGIIKTSAMITHKGIMTLNVSICILKHFNIFKNLSVD